jgi:hypothetical protein
MKVQEKCGNTEGREARLYSLFLRYEKKAKKGVEQGHLFFNSQQIIQHASLMAKFHLENEQESV